MKTSLFLLLAVLMAAFAFCWIIQEPRQDPFFLGEPVSYWRWKVKRRDFHFSGWSGSLSIQNGDQHMFLYVGDAESYKVLPLFLVLAQDENASVRAVATFGLAIYGRNNPKAASALIWALSDENVYVRQTAIREVGQFYHEPWKSRIVSSLIRALRDEDEDVQWEAACSLTALDAPLPPEIQLEVDEIRSQGQGKENISFKSSSLTNVEMLKMVRWTNLQDLDASGSQISDEGLAGLAGLTRLYSLDLAETQVTDAGLVHLKRLIYLRKLNLTGTDVSDAGVADLQAALPKLKIKR